MKLKMNLPKNLGFSSQGAIMGFLMLEPMHQILPPNKQTQKGALYLGNLYAAQNTDLLKKHNINTVLTLGDFELEYNPHDMIHHKVIKVNDSEQQNLIQHFDEIADFLHQKLKDSNALVHCFAGVSRSSTSVICYLMKYKKYSYHEQKQHNQQISRINHQKQQDGQGQKLPVDFGTEIHPQQSFSHHGKALHKPQIKNKLLKKINQEKEHQTISDPNYINFNTKNQLAHQQNMRNLQNQAKIITHQKKQQQQQQQQQQNHKKHNTNVNFSNITAQKLQNLGLGLKKPNFNQQNPQKLPNIGDFSYQTSVQSQLKGSKYLKQ
ncbi:hypothetical protein PPERSA_00544 [Pseudocohnilembus persalinus]|uniref:protein-tyrosine-phosphatase n=1 Tax=Pseudocohnilembus persalinus TaxID=266149 RepID=A0A0V0QIB5_PSEPJ|nr:hypothetical protein PPERSA_00544 [Pseudocohnilembus persalinus]|eukprot:KRX01834.1 hypothetical protein PPERSA_00544 [Pseudocohnilembus persalinus]